MDTDSTNNSTANSAKNGSKRKIIFIVISALVIIILSFTLYKVVQNKNDQDQQVPTEAIESKETEVKNILNTSNKISQGTIQSINMSDGTLSLLSDNGAKKYTVKTPKDNLVVFGAPLDESTADTTKKHSLADLKANDKVVIFGSFINNATIQAEAIQIISRGEVSEEEMQEMLEGFIIQ